MAVPIPTRIQQAFVASFATMTTANGYQLNWVGYSPTFDQESQGAAEQVEANGVARLEYLGASDPQNPPNVRQGIGVEDRVDAWLLTLYLGPGDDLSQSIDERIITAAADGIRVLSTTPLKVVGEANYNLRQVLGPDVAIVTDMADLYAVRLIVRVTYQHKRGRIDLLPGESE